MGEDESVIFNKSRIEVDDRATARADPFGDTFPGVHTMFDEGVVTDAIEVSPIDGRRLVGLEDAPTTDLGRGSRLPSQDRIRRTIGGEGKRRPDGRRQRTQTEEDVPS